MTNEELQAKLSGKELLQTLAAPALSMLFEQAQRNDELVQGLFAQLRAVQNLAGKWRTEYPDSDIAKRCASDVEAITISPEDRKESSLERT
jgi:hypothetical protein